MKNPVFNLMVSNHKYPYGIQALAAFARSTSPASFAI